MIASLRSLGPAPRVGADPWRARAAKVLVDAYDADGSAQIDTAIEIAAIPCNIYLVLEALEPGLDYSYGFDPGYAFVGELLGFGESSREAAYQAMRACGVSSPD